MARSKAKNVGLIGLGIIGSRVAGALRKRGLQVYVWNRTPRPEQNFVGSPAEVAELCDVVQIFVADDAALLEMVRQLSPALTAHHIVTVHCTVAPESMRAACDMVQRRGARFLDAPFTGSKVAAENSQLVYYVAGDEMALKQVRPILEASSKEIVVISDKIGDATVMKVATNIVTAATAQVAAEALALVRKWGIAADLFQRAMKSNATNSTTIEMKVPMMVAGDYEPHFSVKHMLKDVRIGMKLAEHYRLDLPATEVSREMLLAEMKRGRGDADYSSLAQKYFPLSKDVVVRPDPEPEPLKPAAVGTEETVAETREPEDELEPAPEVVELMAVSAVNVAVEEETLPELAEPEEIEDKAAETVTEVEAVEPEKTPPLAEKEEQPVVPPPVPAEEPAQEVGQPIVEPAPEKKENEAKPAEPVTEEKAEEKTEVPTPKVADEKEKDTEKEPEVETEKNEEQEGKPEDTKKDEVPEGVNLSGSLRGWFSRFRSSSKRER